MWKKENNNIFKKALVDILNVIGFRCTACLTQNSKPFIAALICLFALFSMFSLLIHLRGINSADNKALRIWLYIA